MRDIVVTIVILGLIPMILKGPHIGVLVWSWIGYMSPHRLTWGFAQTLPFAQITAIALLFSLLISKEDKRLPMNGIIILWLFFIFWMGLTTIFAVYPELALFDFTTVIKIQLVTFITMMVMKSRERIEMLLWVIFGSVGFYGIKGGVFAVLTGGAHRIYGPPATYFQENNALAIALLMILPIGIYLLQQLKETWHRVIMIACLGSIMMSVVASWSRGAFLAIMCVGLFLLLKSNKKFIVFVSVIPLIPLLFLFMPQDWRERMSTISTYQQDSSAMGRIRSWGLAINVANDNITGGGFAMWGERIYSIYQPEADRFLVAHSIYFHVLGEHGWIGLILFVTIFFMTWRLAGKIRRKTLDDPETRWMGDLSAMIQVSLVAYGSGGAFLSLSYLDLAWHLVAIIMLLDFLQKKAEAEAPEAANRKTKKHYGRAVLQRG